MKKNITSPLIKRKPYVMRKIRRELADAKKNGIYGKKTKRKYREYTKEEISKGEMGKKHRRFINNFMFFIFS